MKTVFICADQGKRIGCRHYTEDTHTQQIELEE